ncbi:MAG: glycosyltransferase family 9 protein [Elusimicrobia bacterium]|nr:glycosyltransferase family 9 protein [Elusimicrobiota bacterium]
MIKSDCIHYPLDRPCLFHKEKGLECFTCTAYVPLLSSGKNKILIIKLGAMGDVLRTTFILPGLKQMYPNCQITWIVALNSIDILKENTYISNIWQMDEDIFKKLLSEKFNILINLDLSAESLALATIAYSDKKIGFWLNEKRMIVCSNSYASHWLAMSSSDPIKKANTNTFQYWMSKIIELPKSDYEIYVPLNKKSVAKANRFAKKHSLAKKIVVGINPGSGKRWKLKKWTDKGFIEIIKKLDSKKIKVLLFGGHEEDKLIKMFMTKTKNAAINTGTNNSIPDFFALLNLCDLVVCGDTLALHAALGLKKDVLAIFGPTSAPEIEMYNRGIKLVSPLNCVCCYRQNCDVKPNCMESLSIEMVWSSLNKLIKE